MEEKLALKESEIEQLREQLRLGVGGESIHSDAAGGVDHGSDSGGDSDAAGLALAAAASVAVAEGVLVAGDEGEPVLDDGLSLV